MPATRKNTGATTMTEGTKISDGLLSDGKLIELLTTADPSTVTLILHLLAVIRAIEERLAALEQIVYVLKRTYKFAKFAWPALIAIAAYALGTR